MGWMYIVPGSCFLLLSFMIWKEAARENTSRLLWRVIASVCAVTSLACMALPIALKRPAVMDNDTQAVLLTDGYKADSIKSFVQKFQKQPAVYSISGDERLPVNINAVHVYEPSTLNAIAAKYAAIHVFGYGFNKPVIDSLQEGKFVFHPAVLPAGIQSIHWVKKLKEGENLVVQGRFYNPGHSTIKILLAGLQAHLDSAMILPVTTGRFALSTVPRFAGKALYSLTVLAGSDTLEQEPVPVQVDTSSAIKVLVLASSPDFENKFLKDWLAKHGYEVEVRTVITTNKYNRLSVNAAGRSPGQISQTMLQHFDVLISDPASLTGLGSAELHTLTSQVAANGLGLIIRADSLLPRSFYAGYFSLSQTTDSMQQQSLYTNDVVPDTAQWLAAQPVYISPSSFAQPLATASGSNTVAGSALYGAGKIILSTVNNSYSWLLAGNEKMYGSFWSLLIKKALRKTIEKESWNYSPAMPVANSAVTIGLETDETGAPRNSISSATVSYKQKALLPFQWQANYWPAQGWHTMQGIQPYSWFVYDQNNWKNMQANRNMLLTKKYISAHGSRQKQTAKHPDTISVPVPKIYFFILFVFSAAYLWIEKKIT